MCFICKVLLSACAHGVKSEMSLDTGRKAPQKQSLLRTDEISFQLQLAVDFVHQRKIAENSKGGLAVDVAFAV